MSLSQLENPLVEQRVVVDGAPAGTIIAVSGNTIVIQWPDGTRDTLSYQQFHAAFDRCEDHWRR